MEILQPLPVEKWPALRDMIKQNWPIYAYYYAWVNNAIKWRRKVPDLEHEIFCPDGKHESGVFIGISKYSINVVVVFSFENSKELLRKILLETSMIKWTKSLLFSAIHENIKDIVLNVIREKEKSTDIELDYITEANCLFKAREECSNIELKIPDECVIRHLNSTDIPLVQSLWTYGASFHPETLAKYLNTIVKLNRGVGLFLKKDNSLISWILHGDLGELGMFQTVEGHKRKGYGKIVVRQMIKELAVEENLDSFLYTAKGNTGAERLFHSLGYVRLVSAFWYTMKSQ